MRILMVSEDLPTPGMGGLARHVLALARALITDGHTVDLMGNDDYRPDDIDEKMTFDGLFFPELHGQFTGWKEMSLGVFMPWKRTLIAHAGQILHLKQIFCFHLWQAPARRRHF